MSDVIEEGVSEGIDAKEENFQVTIYKTALKHGWEETFSTIAK